MRIRKNAKNSTSFYTNRNVLNDSDESLVEKNLCQLNQSPWDIITFPSSDSSSSVLQFDDNEVYYNVNVAGNGSSVESIGDFESVASKTSGLGENDYVNDTKNDYGEVLGFKGELVLCGKIDEKGWQCGRVVKIGNTMCDHHFSELQNYAVWTTKKKPQSVSGPTAKCRPRRTKKQPTTNPYDFYYYSGFGPSWGKKRGATGIVSNACSKFNNVGHETSGVDEYMDVQVEKGKRFEPESSEVGSMDVGLDYVDDNGDDEKGKSGVIGKKRGRKPIKARSLKSLM